MSSRRRTLLYDVSKANTNNVTDIDEFDDNAKIASPINTPATSRSNRRLSRAPIEK